MLRGPFIDFHRFSIDVRQIFIRFSSDFHQIPNRFSLDFQQMVIRFSLDFQQIFIRCSIDVHQIFIRFSIDVHQIFINFLRFSWYCVWVSKALKANLLPLQKPLLDPRLASCHLTTFIVFLRFSGLRDGAGFLSSEDFHRISQILIVLLQISVGFLLALIFIDFH